MISDQRKFGLLKRLYITDSENGITISSKNQVKQKIRSKKIQNGVILPNKKGGQTWAYKY